MWGFGYCWKSIDFLQKIKNNNATCNFLVIVEFESKSIFKEWDTKNVYPVFFQTLEVQHNMFLEFLYLSEIPPRLLQARNQTWRSFYLTSFSSPQMYLVIFPEGTRYNPELKKVISDSQAFATKEGTATLSHVLPFVYCNVFWNEEKSSVRPFFSCFNPWEK